VGGLPWLGSALRIVREPFTFYDTLAEHGDVVRYTVAGQPFCVLLHPDHVEQVLVGEPERFRRWMGDEWDVIGGMGREGLLQTEGEQWRRQRRIVQTAFTPDRIRSYAGAMVAAAERTVDDWADDETVAIDREATQLTLDVLTASLFDLDVADRREVVAAAARELNARANTRLSTFVPNWVPIPSNRRYRRRMAAFEALVADLIDERRGVADDANDLLTLLLRAETDGGETLSEAEVADNLLTFLFAGHETTALALTYALFLLAKHHDEQARLHDEVDGVLDGATPTAADLPSLVHTERVVKEALRLYPPVYLTFREAVEAAEIGGYHIAPGTKLSLPQFHLHTDERFFDDPESFRPSRWTDEFETDLPDYAYFPFGGGPRHCIGMRFAMQELKLVLSTLLARASFDLVSDDDIDLDFQLGITLRPTDPVELRIGFR
jgi:cytochrome P450